MATAAIPLIALDAVVMDTETTGLDPNKARIIEIAVVRLTGGRLDPASPFRRLVRPGVPIPAEATRIHGIDDAAVADAPIFSTVWPELADFMEKTVLIGHSIGFDLAVVKTECRRAEIVWTPPPTLDTRLLAEVVEPNLAGYSLDNLATWLGVDITERHSAIGDAHTTAGIFQALVPKLREVGVRTLAEAGRACQGLTHALEAQHRAGWSEVAAFGGLDARYPFARFDSYPYRHRIRDVMNRPAKFIAADTTVRAALDQMTREAISSLFVSADPDKPARPAQTGIITERDVLRALSAGGPDALAASVSQHMSWPLEAVPADDFVYVAIARMNRLKVRHLGVTEGGVVAGALSARDLLRARAGSAASLDDEIDHAEDVHDLGRAWARLPQVAASLVDEQVSGRDIATVISHMLGTLTRHAAVIAAQRMRGDGLGEPPCAYAFAVLGSAGRGESLLAMDQDNALVFASGNPGGAEDRWFEAFAGHVADILHEAGVPYCTGGVMAKNPQWRGSVSTWNERIAKWISRSDPQDLLSVDIFFDLRAVHGDAQLAETIWRAGFEAARSQTGFAKLLAESAGATPSSLRLFGGIKTERGRIDLKKGGLFGIVSAARVLAVCHHVVERATPARLAGLKALGIGSESDLDALGEAQAVFLDLILAQQLIDIRHGTPATNAVEVVRLTPRDRRRLRDALHAVGNLDELTRALLFKS